MLDRRNFLRNIGLTGSALAIPSALVLAGPAGDPPDLTSEIILKGRVSSAGQGIAGVAVTDGVSIVLTNNAGEYEFPSMATTEFVYISMPSGYEIPQSEGVVNFYRRLKKQSGTIINDFELVKLQGSDRNHVFVVWADPQMKTQEHARKLREEVVPDLQALLKTYPAGTHFHGIGCGDLIWDRFELFSDYKGAVDETGVPFFNLIGNHDLDFDARSDEDSTLTYRKHFGPTWYSFNRGEVHYIMLDNVFYPGMPGKYFGYITEQQLKWLEKDLALLKRGSTVILSLHIPTHTGLFARQGKEEELTMSTSNRVQLYHLLKPFNAHIMSGHTHYNENWEEAGIMEHNHGAVCGAWWTGPICSDGTPGGYGVYEVNGSQLKWYYKSTGLPKEKQFRIYPKGKLPGAPGEIAVNVWNWDSRWKVIWLEDGVVKGPMQQRTGLDPLATELMLGKSLPVQQKWVEPTLNDHLFFAKPSAGAKKITIRVTDRFGNVYEELV